MRLKLTAGERRPKERGVAALGLLLLLAACGDDVPPPPLGLDRPADDASPPGSATVSWRLEVRSGQEARPAKVILLLPRSPV